MASIAENPRAVAGNNLPPLLAHTANIEDLYENATQWLDGSGVKSEADAEGVAKLLVMLREARKAADDQRKVEKAPLDAAVKAKQEEWVPLLAKCDLAVDAAKKALTPWQIEKDAEQRRAADAARAEAERLQREANEARASTSSDDLAGRAASEDALRLASKALRTADTLGKAKPLIASGGRSVGLSTTYITELVDPVKALQHYRSAQPEALKQWLLDQARRDVRGGARSIPGFTIAPERASR